MDYEEIVLDHQRSKEERVQAAFNLANKRGKKPLEVLVRAMQTDLSPVVRHECAFILGETKLAHIGQYLMEAVENDPAPIVKHEALSALGSLGDSSYIPFIKRYLDHPDQIIRDTAEMAIERIKKYKGGKCFS